MKIYEVTGFSWGPDTDLFIASNVDELLVYLVDYYGLDDRDCFIRRANDNVYDFVVNRKLTRRITEHEIEQGHFLSISE